jgi:urease beta subunit
MGTIVVGTVKGKHGEAPVQNGFELVTPGGEAVVVSSPSGVELLASETVRPGDFVAIFGDEERRAEPDGYDGVGAVARSVTALAVAVGNHADKALAEWCEKTGAKNERPSQPKAPVTPRATSKPAFERERALPIGVVMTVGLVGGALLAAGVLAWLAELGPRTLRPELLAAGSGLVAIAIFAWRGRRALPSFHVAGQRYEGHGHLLWRTDDLVFVYLPMLLASAVIFTSLALSAGFAPAAVIVMLVAAALPFAFASSLLGAEWESMRFLRLATATPTFRDGDETTRALEITLEEGQLQRELSAIAHRRPRDVAAYWHWTEMNHANDFELVGRTASGRRVRVRAGKAAFASMVREVRIEAGQLTMREAIEPGMKVLVIGRFTRDGEDLVAAAAGPEPLVVLGAREDPRRAARRAALVHRGALLSLAALAVGLAVVGWHNPFQTHRTVAARVVEASGFGGSVDAGDPCVLELGYAEGAERACQAALSCGGQELYGGIATGFFECRVEDGAWWTGRDYDVSDGDAALQLVGARGLEWWTADGRRLVIELDRDDVSEDRIPASAAL